MSMKEDPVKELKDAYEHWNDLFENGCYDPTWEDGVNLNLIRNHMIYYKKQIEEQYNEHEKPDIYYRELPKEVEATYMARKEEILQDAMDVYKALSGMPMMRDLMMAKQYMTEEELQELHIAGDIHHITGLKEAIDKEDYVRMRTLSSNLSDRMEEVKEAHERLMNRQYQDGVQMSIFDMLQ